MFISLLPAGALGTQQAPQGLLAILIIPQPAGSSVFQGKSAWLCPLCPGSLTLLHRVLGQSRAVNPAAGGALGVSGAVSAGGSVAGSVQEALAVHMAHSDPALCLRAAAP